MTTGRRTRADSLSSRGHCTQREDGFGDFPGAGLMAFEGRVEGLAWGGEVDGFDEGRGLTGAVDPVHAGVFPFDGEGALVVGAVQGADDGFEVDLAAPG